MANKIVLVSDDTDFFEYIKTKLELRKSDEVFTLKFDSVPDKIQFLETAVIIVDSENSKEKTIDLLKLFNGAPIIVTAYNEDDSFKRKCYRVGMLDFITLLTSDSDFKAKMLPALAISSLLEKNKQYKDFLVMKKFITETNEVFLDYETVLDNALNKLIKEKRKAVFIAISPNDKTKFLVNSNLIESIILNNIRKCDILMTYAPNKYFLLVYDLDMNSAEKLWGKICSQFSEKVYAGFCNVLNQKSQSS